MRKKTRLALVGAALALAGSGITIPFAGPASASVASVTIVNSSGSLADGGTVTLTGTGFPAHSADPLGLEIIECSDPGGSPSNLPFDPALGCDGNTVSSNQINTDASGNFHTTLHRDKAGRALAHRTSTATPRMIASSGWASTTTTTSTIRRPRRSPRRSRSSHRPSHRPPARRSRPSRPPRSPCTRRGRPSRPTPARHHRDGGASLGRDVPRQRQRDGHAVRQAQHGRVPSRSPSGRSTVAAADATQSFCSVVGLQGDHDLAALGEDRPLLQRSDSLCSEVRRRTSSR